jgi:hypothetical protein
MPACEIAASLKGRRVFQFSGADADISAIQPLSSRVAFNLPM